MKFNRAEREVFHYDPGKSVQILAGGHSALQFFWGWDWGIIYVNGQVMGGCRSHSFVFEYRNS